MDTLLVSLLNGLIYGLLLFMVSAGLTLIFGMMGVLNFAHASFYMLGAYFAYSFQPVIGFWLAHCMAAPEMLDVAMGELLPMVAAGELEPISGGRYPLTAVREAHQDILSRRTTGKLSLDPSR